jgi:hypothetical protein
MNGPGLEDHRSGLVNGFYTARYIVGMFVTGFPNEACYLLTSVCNDARYRYVGHPYSNLPTCRLHPGTSQDLTAVRGCILPSWNQPGYDSHHSKEIS